MSLMFANLCVSFRPDQHLACWSLAKVHEFNKLLILAGFVRSFTQIDVKAYCLCLYQFCEFLWSFPGYHGKNNTNRWISDSKKMEVFCLSIFCWKFLPRKKLQVQRLNHSNWYQERKYEATTNGLSPSTALIFCPGVPTSISPVQIIEQEKTLLAF